MVGLTTAVSPFLVVYVSKVRRWMLHTYISSIIRSGFHRTSVGIVIFEIPQNFVLFQLIWGFAHFWRGKREKTNMLRQKRRFWIETSVVLFSAARSFLKLFDFTVFLWTVLVVSQGKIMFSWNSTSIVSTYNLPTPR